MVEMSPARHRYFRVFIFALIFILVVAEVRSQPGDPVDEIINAGDIVDVDVIGSTEYDWRGGLTPDGYLEGLDEFDGPIPALCRSTAELATAIELVLGKALREPKVVVTIVDRSRRPMVRFDGALKNPSRFVVRRAVRLGELIVLAGGLTDDASGDIRIFRPANAACSADGSNSSRSLNIKFSEMIKGTADADPLILPGDIIEAERSLPVYIYGAVTAPRTLIYRDGLTLVRALDAAGGPLKISEPGRIVIMRREDGQMRTIVVERSSTKKAEIVDELLKAFDIIIVSAKGDKDLKYPPVLPGPAKVRPDSDLPVRVIDQ